MENVRKNVQSELESCLRKYFRRSRKLLLMPMEKLTEEQKDKVAIMLQFSKKLQDAYLLKEYFHEFMQSESSAEAKERLHKFRILASTIRLEEFDVCLRVPEKREPYILNAFDARLSNGFTEGTNNLIKVI